jgi:choline dehydrogenase-like flavoprotein
VQVNLPGVGHGLVDHPNNGITAPFRDPNNTFSGLPPYVAYPTASDVFGFDTKSVAERLRRAVPESAAQVVAGAGNITSVQAQERIMNLALDMIFDHPDTTPLGEIFVYPNLAWPSGEPGTAILSVWPSQPFSRGSIHIGSRDPLDYPVIDYNFHHVQADMVIQIGLMRYARRFFSTAPFSSFVGEETSPGLSALPIDASDDLWEEWIRSTAETTSHEVGTAAMRPKELGGVIDSHLRVYGTQNVRVIDASIWPSHLSGHLSGTCYMVAEKAADIFLAERKP